MLLSVKLFFLCYTSANDLYFFYFYNFFNDNIFIHNNLSIHFKLRKSVSHYIASWKVLSILQSVCNCWNLVVHHIIMEATKPESYLTQDRQRPIRIHLPSSLYLWRYLHLYCTSLILTLFILSVHNSIDLGG